MNFKIFDDEFDENKSQYLEEVKNLSKGVILVEKQGEWETFVNKVLKNTRNYYILTYALKVMHNLEKKNTFGNLDDFYNNALLSAMSFMPDKTFVETSIMIVAKFNKNGNALAENQNVDVDTLCKKAKIQAKMERMQRQAQIESINKSITLSKNTTKNSK